MRQNLEGIFAPIPTPFTPAGQVDFERLRQNLERWEEQPLTGLVAGGSNGEFVLLSLEERVEVVRAVRKGVSNGRTVIAGSGVESTQATIELTRRMAEAGANAALVVTPSYYKGRMTPEALRRHFCAVADASPIPLVLYNVPANTGVDLTAATVIELSQHENIIGIKDSGGDMTKMGIMVRGSGADFQVLAGSAGFLLAALALGAVGCIAALANIAGTELRRLYDAFGRGDMAEAKRIQLALIEPNMAVITRYGVPGLKAALDMLGYYGGPPRPPLFPLSEAEREDLRSVLVRGGLLPA